MEKLPIFMQEVKDLSNFVIQNDEVFRRDKNRLRMRKCLYFVGYISKFTIFMELAHVQCLHCPQFHREKITITKLEFSLLCLSICIIIIYYVSPSSMSLLLLCRIAKGIERSLIQFYLF